MAQSFLLSSKGALHGHYLLFKMCGSILLAFPSLWFSDNLLLRVLVVWSYRSELCLGSHRQTVPGRPLAALTEASALFLEKIHYKSKVLAALKKFPRRSFRYCIALRRIREECSLP